MLTDAERQQIIVQWNNTQAAYPHDKCLHHLFEAQVEQTPDAMALAFETTRLTYRELDRRANQLARYLQDLGVGPELLVGLCVDRSPDLIVGLLAILKAGGAYVPLDPTYPKDRLAFMLDDARATIVLTQEHLLKHLPSRGVRPVCLDSGWEVISAESPERPRSDVAPDNLAYVIYTSGSTGRPKGVQVLHRGLSNLATAMRVFGVRPDDRVLQFASISFDASIWDIIMALQTGASLHLARRETLLPGPAFMRFLRDQAITVITLPPSVLAVLPVEELPALRTIIMGGEACSARLVALWATGRTFFNVYGPTETTVVVTVTQCLERAEKPSIGRCIPNTQAYVLDEALQPVGIGVPGELYIGGVCLARGYLNRPDLTAERFITDPFSEEPGARIYKTGDLVRWLPDGNIDYLGRIDDQVKIRGYRIELGEIEAILARYDGVHNAVVLAREDIPGDKRLVAYLVPEEGRDLRIADVRRFLNEQLPNYMVPAAFVILPELPLMPNGKLDRHALPTPEDVEVPTQDHVLPRDSVEELVAEIWATVLGRERVGVTADFFDLGGHSLAAVQVVSRIRDIFGVELPLEYIFQSPTVAALAQRINAAVAQPDRAELAPIRPVPRETLLPLSFAQERAWFIEQLVPRNLAYNVQATLRLSGWLNVDALDYCLTELVRRHEILRSTFPEIDGRPVQLIHSDWRPTIHTVDLRSLPANESPDEVERLIHEEIRTPFDPVRLPLIRWTLLTLEDDEHLLVHVEHHLVHDGWSFNVLLHEVVELYKAFVAGTASPLPDLPIQFADFASWQRDWMRTPDAKRQLGYWKEKLAGSLPLLELPYDRPRPAIQRFVGAALRIDLPPALCESLVRQGSTLFMTLLAAFFALLHRYTGRSDISVGSSIANRRRPETEQLIGMILNNIVFRVDLSGDPAFSQLLTRVRRTALDAYAHQDVPFDKVVESVQPERDLSYNPLFQVMFAFHDSALPDLHLPRLNVSIREALNNGSAKFDLNLTVIPRSEHRADTEGITMIWEYNSDLFDETTVARLAGHYRTLLESVVESPDARITSLALLTEAERRQLLIHWNETKTDYPHESCIHELFEAQVDRTPDAVAVMFEGTQRTYRELNGEANQLANYLRRLGVGPEVLVGLCLERSLDLVVGLLGILKAGGAYVPLDPAYPKDRLAFMLEDATLRVLLTQQSLLPNLPSHSARAVCFDSEWSAIARESARSVFSGAVPENSAYVIYTSGSTGRPKGVQVLHRGVVNLLSAMGHALRPTARDVTLGVTSLSFDIAALELFLPLMTGATVVVANRQVTSDGERLRELITESAATIMQATPATWRLLRETGWRPTAPFTVLCGGDEFPRELADQMRGDGVVVWNLYGPTETTIWSTAHRLDGDGPQEGRIPIGRPLANTEVYVLDGQLRPVPIGVQGQLYLGGTGLARGYLNRPDLTAEKFLPHPFSNTPGERLYATGDLARYRPDATIEFLGRMDNQVKLRGFRIELGEIETVLRECPSILESVVLLREDIRGDKRLVGYIVPQRGQIPTPRDLRDYLGARLPQYMVPSTFVFLDHFPLTPNRKIDRRALPAPAVDRQTPNRTSIPPRTPVEKTLAGLWTDLLQISDISVDDGFFELGGHSLLAAQLISRINRAFEVQLPLRGLFETPTVAGLARTVERATGGRCAKLTAPARATSDEDWSNLDGRRYARDASVRRSPLVRLRHGRSRQVFTCVHPVGGTVFCYLGLASHLNAEYSFYGVQAPGVDGEQLPYISVEDMADHYVTALRALQPEGPYLLGGWSIGGVVAFEMARQLDASGHTVDLLALLDSTLWHPEASWRLGGVQTVASLLPESLRNNANSVRDEYPNVGVTRDQYLAHMMEQKAPSVMPPGDAGPSDFGHLFDVFRANELAWRSYTPRAFPRPVTLFRAAESPSNRIVSPQARWWELALGGVELRVVPGNHYTMLREPHVKVLADHLNQCLDALLLAH